MSTSAQKKANQENAQRSTGPRTIEGKQRSSRNAIKHGLCAGEPLIPGEDPEEFEEHIRQIADDLRPSGYIEEELVEQVADVSWRLKRLARIEAAVITEFYDATAAQPQNQCTDEDLIGQALARHNRLDALNRLSRYEAQLSRRYHRALKELRDRRKERIQGGRGNLVTKPRLKQPNEPNRNPNCNSGRPPNNRHGSKSTEPTQSVATLLESIAP